MSWSHDHLSLLWTGCSSAVSVCFSNCSVAGVLRNSSTLVSESIYVYIYIYITSIS